MDNKTAISFAVEVSWKKVLIYISKQTGLSVSDIVRQCLMRSLPEIYGSELQKYHNEKEQ